MKWMIIPAIVGLGSGIVAHEFLSFSPFSFEILTVGALGIAAYSLGLFSS